MKRALLLLMFLGCSIPAFAGISVGVACTPASATSCTLSGAPASGDFMVAYAYRGSSATAATTATGWTVIKSTTGSVNSLKIAWKYAVGGETNCGTWTNASQTFCQVYKGGWITASTIGGIISTATPSGTTATSGALSYPTFTLQNPFSTSWVVCAGGSVSGTADAAPTGQTLRSGTSVTNIMYSDTNGNVSTWGTNTGSSPGVKWATACFEMVGSPSTVAGISTSDYLVYTRTASISNEACSGTCTLKIPVKTSLTNNFLRVSFAWNYTTTAPTVSNIYCNADTGHSTWTWTQLSNGTSVPVLDVTDTQSQYVYYIAGAAAGCNTVTIVASSLWTEAEVEYEELRQIATVSPVDVMAGQRSTGFPYFTAGSFTPGTSGDLVLQSCTQANLAGVGGGSNGTSIWDSAGITPISLNATWTMDTGAFIYSSTSALTENQIYWNGTAGLTANATCTLMALKVSAGAGTSPPAGVHEVATWDYIGTATATTVPFQFTSFTTGDALLISANGAGNASANATQFTGVTDQIGNTYTTYLPHDPNGGYPNYALDCNGTAGNNLVTFTGVNNSTVQHWYVTEFGGQDNSSHTACQDSTAGIGSCGGTGSSCPGGVPIGVNAATTTATSMPTITPSTADGIVIWDSELGTGDFGGATPATVNAPACGVFDVITYTGQTDTSKMGSGNFHGYCLNSSTSAQNWGATNGATSTNWNAAAIRIKPVAALAGKRHRGSVIN